MKHQLSDPRGVRARPTRDERILSQAFALLSAAQMATKRCSRRQLPNTWRKVVRHGIRMPTKVRLTRKFADRLDGVDLSKVRPGEQIDVTQHEAELLIAEGWAVPADQVAIAHDKRPRRRRPKSAKR